MTVSLLEPPILRRIGLEVEKVSGVNLAQGICQLPVPEEVVEFAKQAIDDGINRYTHQRGLKSLRDAISDKRGVFEEEVLVTSGATGAFDSLCAALLDIGDKAVMIEPYYPYHRMVLNKYGAKVLTVSLNNIGWKINFDEVEAALKQSPKVFVITNPGNPTGKVYSKDELENLIELCKAYNCHLISDETYEYIVYKPFYSAGTFKSNNVSVVGSFSKTFSITGWRVGYLVSNSELIDLVSPLHDLTYICAPAPLQEAVARALKYLPDSFYLDLKKKYEVKRDILFFGLKAVGFKVFKPEGAYYLIVDFRDIAPDLSSYDCVMKMIRECGVGAVPSDDFVSQKASWARFCYALEDSVLLEVRERLKNLT